MAGALQKSNELDYLIYMKTGSFFKQLYSLLLLFIFITPCSAQPATLAKDSTRQPKLTRNHFIPQYPSSFWRVQCGLQDKEGKLWFGTNADGVYSFNGTSFANYTVNDGLCHNDVLCMLEDKAGNIWFGTRGGVCRYKPSNARAGRNSFSRFQITGNRFSPNFVWSMMQDKSGRIWFGTTEGVFFYKPSINDDAPVFIRFPDNDSIINPNKLRLEMIQDMYEDKSGAIWFCSGSFDAEGICRYDGRSITNFKPDGISSFRSVLETKSGNLLFLSQLHGVYAYDDRLNDFSNFTKTIGLKNDTIYAMTEDRSGNLWFATYGNSFENAGSGGLWCYDPSAGADPLKLFTTKDGLSHNCVFCVLEDRTGNLWFGTSNTGLCRYTPPAQGKSPGSFTDFTE
jgi:ligand-binding sensor domain-containing protein